MRQSAGHQRKGGIRVLVQHGASSPQLLLFALAVLKEAVVFQHIDLEIEPLYLGLVGMIKAAARCSRSLRRVAQSGE